MRIQVTQKDIDNGISHSCSDCPVALAMVRASGSSNVNAGFSKLRIGNYCMGTPKNVKTFMLKFDGGYLVEPFEFEFR